MTREEMLRIAKPILFNRETFFEYKGHYHYKTYA